MGVRVGPKEKGQGDVAGTVQTCIFIVKGISLVHLKLRVWGRAKGNL